MHPSREHLQGVVQGTLPEPEAEEVVEHVEHCPDCEQTLRHLEAAEDTFVSSLRAPQNPHSYERESDCDRLVEIMEKFGHEPSLNQDSVLNGDASDLELKQLGQYQLLAKIGEGGMGAVYKARHEKLDKIVAIKVLPAERMKDAQAVSRFEREMRAVGKLEHPNIVRAMDAGEVDGMHFLVMEYVQGVDLSQIVRQHGPLPIADACELIRQAATGLEEANDNGMVHRDIKPSNLILADRKRKPPIVKILDMGLALLSEAHSPDAAGLTTTGQMMGTLDYMAPEQGGDSKGVDIRADIYALGATLYRLLTGEVIYHGEKYTTPVQKMMALAVTPAPAIQDRREGIPDQLAAIVHRMLEKNPADRFATPQEVADALGPFCSGANLRKLLEADSVRAEAAVDSSPSVTVPGTPAAEVDTAPSNESLTKVSLGSPAAVAPAAPRSVPPVKQPKTRSSGNRKIPNQVYIAAGGGFMGLLALVSAIVFFFQTPSGTLRVEINDPSVEVTVKGTDIILTQADKEQVTLSPGEKTLIIKRGDFSFETDKLVLKKGASTTVQVELVKGEIQVAMAGGHQLGRAELPQANAAQQLPSDEGTERSAGLLFDGSNDYVVIPSLKYEGSHPITIEAWVVCRQVRNPGGMVVSLNSPKDARQYAILGYSDQERSFWAAHYHNAGVQLNGQVTNLPLAFNRQVHLAAVFDGEQPHLFIDGNRILHGWRGDFKTTFKQQGLLIGCSDIDGGKPVNGFDGYISAVRMSKGIRYEKDFAPLARLENDEHTLALYHFDEGAGEVLRDSSGNNHHGKIVGAKWVKAESGSVPNVVAERGSEYALEFRKIQECVELPPLPLEFDQPFTVEAWVEPRDGTPFAPWIVFGDLYHFSLYNIKSTNYWQMAVQDPGQNHWYIAQPALVDWNDNKGRKVHLVGQWTGEKTQLFLDGKLVTADPVIQLNDAFPDFKAFVKDRWKDLSTTPLRIGGCVEGEAETPENYGGRIYSVRVSRGVRYAQDFAPQELTSDAETIACYEFRDGQGDILKDSSGNNHHGKIVGAKWVKSDQSAETFALEFDGIDDQVEIPTLKPQEGSISIEAWAVVDNSEGVCISLADGARHIDLWHLEVDGMTHSAGMETPAVGHTPIGEPVVRHRLCHYAGVWDGQAVKFYVDGKLRSTVGQQTPGSTLKHSGTRLGGVKLARDGGEEARWFKGRLLEIRISSSARYEEDFEPRRRLMADDRTLALYHFNEGSGDVLQDSSGNNHHGKIVGAKWVKAESGSVPNVVAERGSEYALEFQKIQECVELPPLPLAFEQPFTVEAWAEPRDGKLVDPWIVFGDPYHFALRNLIATNYWQMTVEDPGQNHIYTTQPANVDHDLKGRKVHIAGQWTGEKTQLFIDGKLVTADPWIKLKDASPDFKAFVKDRWKDLSTTRLAIGGFLEDDRQTPDNYGGRIYSVRVSRGVRYAQDFAPQELTSDADTIACYEFRDGQGDILKDSSGNNHHGKIVGAKWVRADGGSVGAATSAIAPFDALAAKLHQDNWAKYVGKPVETTNSIGMQF